MTINLLNDICYCQNFLNNNQQVCKSINDFQNQFYGADSGVRQLPEPWSGDIINAPVLFISSNPSFSENELYPNSAWPVNITRDFFINRFKNRGIEFSWVWNHKVLHKNGNRGRAVNYWSSIKKRAEELCQREVIPGTDYSMTELTHCKSTGQTGVLQALNECAQNHISRILKISHAQVIIGIGSIVASYFKREDNVNDTPILYLPHPNARILKTFECCYSENAETLENIRAILQNVNNDTNPDELYNLPTEAEVINFIQDQLNNNYELD